MKDYELGKWGIAFIFSLEGSVFPKALACAFPNAVLAVGMWYLLRAVVPQNNVDIITSGFVERQVWHVYNWLIGFLVSFRAQRAYSRWWEGGTLLQQARGEWFNAYSSLIAFCTQTNEKMEQVVKFQKCLARLTSMLYASALMSVATVDDLDFEIIDATGLSEDHLRYLRTQQDKCEIIMQWIQRLIVDNMENGVIPIPPPVLSRVFQELSRGIVNIHNVRKITEFQFPFPAAQMTVTMLLVQWMLTPFMAAFLMQTPVWAFILSFFPVFVCWGINYMAGEIEQPFGTDANDMPLHLMQTSLNTSVLSLLDRLAQRPPEFDQTAEDIQNEYEFAAASCASVQGYHDRREYRFSKMRSVRHVTIKDDQQARGVRRRFTHNGQERSTAKMKEVMESGANYLFGATTSNPAYSRPSSRASKASVFHSSSLASEHSPLEVVHPSSRADKASVFHSSSLASDHPSLEVVHVPSSASTRKLGRQVSFAQRHLDLHPIDATSNPGSDAMIDTGHEHSQPSTSGSDSGSGLQRSNSAPSTLQGSAQQTSNIAPRFFTATHISNSRDEHDGSGSVIDTDTSAGTPNGDSRGQHHAASSAPHICKTTIGLQLADVGVSFSL